MRLVAADSVLIPLNGEYFALEGIAELTGDHRARAHGAQSASRARRCAADDVPTTAPTSASRWARTSASSSARRSTRPSSRATSGWAKRRATACPSSSTTPDPRRRGLHRARARIHAPTRRRRHGARHRPMTDPASYGGSMVERRPALGRGLSALIPVAPCASPAARPRGAAAARLKWTSIC